MDDPARPWDVSNDGVSAPTQGRKLWPWVVGLLVVVGGASALAGSGGSEPDKYGAQVACEDRVRTLLKAPSSADFSGVVTASSGHNAWNVTGSVDSENSFGAAIRGAFTCHARSDDGELWTTSRVKIN